MSNLNKRGIHIMIGKAQKAIINYYIAKEKWLKDTTEKDKDFINTELLSEICLWTDEECTNIIKSILHTTYDDCTGSFDEDTCPHCIKYNYRCSECTSGNNPWNYYIRYVFCVSIIPKHIIDILRKEI